MTGAMVDVVLPCLNERGALPWVLSRMPEGYRAIVVDNGSTDGSAELAASLGALVVREDRRGFGAAAHAGLLAATAELVAFCDCDGSLDPAQLPPWSPPFSMAQRSWCWAAASRSVVRGLCMPGSPTSFSPGGSVA
ncbi:glycosyltransferase [Pseudarthrobacter sp. So.54]